MQFDKDKKVYILTEDEMNQLVLRSEAAREFLSDIYLLRDNVMNVAKAFKLTTKDGKAIRPSIIDKTENPVKSLVKGGMGILGNMTLAAAGVAYAEKEIEEQFGFLGSLGPILKKYGGTGEQAIENRVFQKQLPPPSNNGKSAIDNLKQNNALNHGESK